MIITFCGHKDIFFRNDLEEKVSATIEEITGGEDVTFYLGRDGSFDGIVIEACKKYRAEHPKSKMIFVTPYIFEEYMELRRWWLKEFDDIIYPELERTPYRYRIAKRNEWMVREADYLIAYVTRGWGGAAGALRYAHRRKKPYVNLGDYVVE